MPCAWVSKIRSRRYWRSHYERRANELQSDERFTRALQSTAAHRGTAEIVMNWSSGLTLIADSKVMHERWAKYSKEFSYAKGISFDDVCAKIQSVLTEINFRL